MNCQKCGTSTSVCDSRTLNGGKSIRRRRLCGSCGHRFTTYEHAAYDHAPLNPQQSTEIKAVRDVLEALKITLDKIEADLSSPKLNG